MTIGTQRLRFLRGNTAAASAFTGLGGELIVDTTLGTIRVQDGSTPGGTLLATAAQLANVAANVSTGNYGNANVAAYLPTYSGNLTAGNILSNNYLYANGVNILTGIQSNYGNANVAAYLVANPQPGTYSNTNVASYLPTYTGAVGAGNINSPLGLTISSGLSDWVFDAIGVLSAPGEINTPGNISAWYFLGDGSQLTGISTYSDANVSTFLSSTFLPNYTGNISAGNVMVSGNLIISNGGNIIQQNFYGNTGNFYGDPTTGFGAFYAGKTGFTPVPQTLAQISGNYNSYAQVNLENQNGGDQATADYIVTADNGTDSTYYVDLGIASSGYNGLVSNNSLGTSLYPNDAYLYAQGNTNVTVGGNLVIGTTTDSKNIKFISGGSNTEHIAVQINHPNVGNTLQVTGGITASNIAADIVKGSKTWTFESNGALTVPGDGGIRGTPGLYSVSLSQTGGCVYVSSTNTNFSNYAQIALAYSSGVTIATSTGTQKGWTFSPTGNLSYPDGTKTSGNTVTLANSDSYYWNFNEPAGPVSDTITLSFNSLTTTLSNWYFGTDSTANTWILDSSIKSIGFSDSPGHSVGGRLTFGTLANLGNAQANDIELSSVNANAYVRADNSIWKFDSHGNLTLPAVFSVPPTMPASTVNGIRFYDGLQTTAWTGIAPIASRLASINGTYYAEVDNEGNVRLPGNVQVAGDTLLFDFGTTLTQSNSSVVIAAQAEVDAWGDWQANIGGLEPYTLSNTPNGATTFANVVINSSASAAALGTWLDDAWAIQQGGTDPLWISPAISAALRNQLRTFFAAIGGSYYRLEEILKSVDLITGNSVYTFGSDGNIILPNAARIIYANGVNILSSVAGTYSNANVASYLMSNSNITITTIRTCSPLYIQC